MCPKCFTITSFSSWDQFFLVEELEANDSAVSSHWWVASWGWLSGRSCGLRLGRSGWLGVERPPLLSALWRLRTLSTTFLTIESNGIRALRITLSLFIRDFTSAVRICLLEVMRLAKTLPISSCCWRVNLLGPGESCLVVGKSDSFSGTLACALEISHCSMEVSSTTSTLG